MSDLEYVNYAIELIEAAHEALRKVSEVLDENPKLRNNELVMGVSQVVAQSVLNEVSYTIAKLNGSRA